MRGGVSGNGNGSGSGGTVSGIEGEQGFNGKERPYMSIFDPFHRFDDFYAIGPSSQHRTAPPPITITHSNNHNQNNEYPRDYPREFPNTLHPNWTYDYFHVDGGNKGGIGGQICSTERILNDPAHDGGRVNNTTM